MYKIGFYYILHFILPLRVHFGTLTAKGIRQLAFFFYFCVLEWGGR